MRTPTRLRYCNSLMISMATKEELKCPHLDGFHSTGVSPSNWGQVYRLPVSWILSAGASPLAREELRGQKLLSDIHASLHPLQKTWICNNWGRMEFCRLLKLWETLFSTIKKGLKEGRCEWQIRGSIPRAPHITASHQGKKFWNVNSSIFLFFRKQTKKYSQHIPLTIVL